MSAGLDLWMATVQRRPEDAPLSEFALKQWPNDRPHPTAEQIKLAEARMLESAAKDYESGYRGDWGFSLDFTMATYARPCWWHLFFPDEKLEFDAFAD